MVREALREERVSLAFQPIVRADAPHQPAFYEGLVRISDRDGAEILPGAFLPRIRETPEAAALDIAVLRMSLDALARNPCLRLSVNIGVDTIRDPTWIDTLRLAALLQPDLAYRLIVEITEDGNILSLPETRSFVQTLRAFGSNVALDDFGAGATSLRYLREYRFDMIKFDGGLCGNLAGDMDLQCILRAMVDIARHFDLVTVAEFVRCERDAHMANRLGIDCLQGAFIGMPEALPEKVTPGLRERA